MRRAFIKVQLPSEEMAKIVFEALNPETMSSPTPRSKVEIAIEGKRIMLTINARDTTALRAAVNAYLRWINSIRKVLEMLQSCQVKVYRKSN